MQDFFDYSNSFIMEHELESIIPHIVLADQMLIEKNGPGSNYLGWYDQQSKVSSKEVDKVKEASIRIQKNSDILIVIGIGGSYLGAKAVISALSHTFENELSNRTGPKIYFAGYSMSPSYLKDLLDILKGKDFSVNVISKSGTTMEAAVAFRFFKKILLDKYGKEGAAKRIFVTTDPHKGALKEMADREGYTAFEIPQDIGGRYSVQTPVGLLPMAVKSIDIDDFLCGVQDAMEEFKKQDISNPCYQYSALRNILYRRGKDIEILVNYEPKLHYISEWWKQLFGESEGKDGKGIFPASANFSTDLHSIGQMIQDGKRNLFETIINVKNSPVDMFVPEAEDDLDGLNYLQGKGMHFINQQAYKGSLQAHIQGNVPNAIINLPEISAYYLGKLIYFFEKSCALSGYLLGVNPFDQPGVEAYKKNMFSLLGKPDN